MLHAVATLPVSVGGDYLLTEPPLNLMYSKQLSAASHPPAATEPLRHQYAQAQPKLRHHLLPTICDSFYRDKSP